jgi:hypothetical protein
LQAYEAGLALDPTNMALLVNLGLITRLARGDDAARRAYLK